ncbi:hypothetical protein DLJ49_14840 [Rhodovulum sp. 12E13]|uniref:hypothetical protein n=1 Tax=Rhodovulum sp. 12E13 TaxID=2203891 RepID=UPI000E11E2AD|nr:hypothetical protein [Rhodovulum sp. 12E13]RDC71296.1 hypothetical protein DLJ49_14840 [Rhodovulum sp. 12E13]
MKARIITAAALTALTLGVAAHAQEDPAMGQGFNMLTGAVYNALSAQGFDTSNINDLSLSEIAQIRNLLTGDMGNSERQRIELILERAAG